MFYLFATVPGIWVLEITRMYQYQDKMENNSTAAATAKLEQIEGVHKTTSLFIKSKSFEYGRFKKNPYISLIPT